jgi:hypothetical protein
LIWAILRIVRATTIKCAKEGASVAFVYLSFHYQLFKIKVKGLAIKVDWATQLIFEAFKGKIQRNSNGNSVAVDQTITIGHCVALNKTC